MNINTFATYFPNTLDTENLSAYNENLRLWLAANHETELDTKPGSVIGDLVVNSESIINAALDQALSNFTSDLDLANPASGVIYNCDFVGKYVENFSTTSYTDISSSGTIRLIFSDDSYRVIDRGTQFRNNGQIFVPRVYKDGNLRILSPGQTKSYDTNDYVLTGIGSRFYVDIPVYSMEGAEVANLDTFEISELVTGLVEIYAVGDFWSKSTTNSIQELANRTRVTAVSANATTRSGLVRLVRQEFPEMLAVSPVLVGDYEMTRQSVNPLGLPSPVVDLYIKTPTYGTVLKEPIRLNFDETTQSYFGELLLQDSPLKINSLAFSDNSLETLEFTSYFLSDADNLPALSAYGTTKNRIWVNVPVPLNSSGTAILPPVLDPVTNLFYQIFEVTYTADPGLRIVEDFFASPDTKPVGIDLVVRSFLPIDFTALYVNHARKRGVKINQAKARSEITSYLQTISWPDTYSDASIIDSMFYSGASNVFKIEADAELLVGPCDYLLREVPADASFVLDENNITEIPKFRITGSNNFGYVSKDTEPDFEINTHYATGPRNISFLINNNQILFREVGNNVV